MLRFLCTAYRHGITCQSSTTYRRTGRHCPLELEGVRGNLGTCESVTRNQFIVPRPMKWGRGTIEFATVCPSVHFVSIRGSTTARYTSHSLYHAPGIAPFAENTIILSRQGRLELRVHWFYNWSPLLVQETPTTTVAIPNSCWIHAWESRVRVLEKCTMINHILAFLLIRI